jgi:small subunit ribosomal protein S16
MDIYSQERQFMAVNIRLARHGSKKKPFYRVVAADTQFPRDGRFLEIVGTYDPRNKATGIKLNLQAITAWIDRGALVSPTVRRIMKHSASTTPAAQ